VRADRRLWIGGWLFTGGGLGQYVAFLAIVAHVWGLIGRAGLHLRATLVNRAMAHPALSLERAAGRNGHPLDQSCC
jgi:hypothetical protein